MKLFKILKESQKKSVLYWRMVQSSRSGKKYVRIWDDAGNEKDFPIPPGDEDAGPTVFTLSAKLAPMGYELRHHRMRGYPG